MWKRGDHDFQAFFGLFKDDQMSEAIRQHQQLARGEGLMSGESCESPFKSGVSHDGGESKKRALKDGARSHDGVTRHPDHGPHGMGVPNPRTD